jgi:hypothetical protein
MTHNDLKKGDRVLCSPRSCPRIAIMADSRKGIIRYIDCTDANGYCPETGSIYVDEILAVAKPGESEQKNWAWETLSLQKSHAKQLAEIRGAFPAWR